LNLYVLPYIITYAIWLYMTFFPFRATKVTEFVGFSFYILDILSNK